MDVLKLGTRRSLLAWAQSSWVARELERLNPGVKVELVGIDTRGDKILDIPLSKVEGKEFFVAELDNALKSGAVDLNVHSLKDLSLDRPAEFLLACMPRRENQRDVVLFGPKVTEKLKRREALRIGSSSPRRLENLPPFLTEALPRFATEEEDLADRDAPAPKVEFVEIRGNVNTRLGRLHEPEGSERHLDGVVLAFAGLIRLWRDESGRKELEKLFRGVRWMVMPLRQCPSAPGQGALAVECRANDEKTIRILKALHDPRTEKNVAREREVLRQWGGGCHQRFGASCLESAELGELFYVRGVKSDGEFVEDLQWNRPAPSEKAASGVWDGGFWRGSAKEWTYNEEHAKELASRRCVFVAHSRAVPQDWAELLGQSRIWTSGTSSWFRLAKMGVWVEGCTENLGFDEFTATLGQPVLQLDPLASWAVLTHENGAESWSAEYGRVLSTYRVVEDREEAARAALKTATHVFWGSATQFDRYQQWCPKGADHACGPGKTAKHLKSLGLHPKVFLSSEEWRKWLAK